VLKVSVALSPVHPGDAASQLAVRISSQLYCGSVYEKMAPQPPHLRSMDLEPLVRSMRRGSCGLIRMRSRVRYPERGGLVCGELSTCGLLHFANRLGGFFKALLQLPVYICFSKVKKSRSLKPAGLDPVIHTLVRRVP
jgi:hypothetical protein